MTAQAGAGVTFYRRLAGMAVVATLGMIVLGGIVRITGSGMGCGDHWPLCHGRLFPPLDDVRTIIEYGHRWMAALMSLAILGLGLVAWARHRSDDRLRTPATIGVALFVGQVLLGPIIVKLDLPPAVVVVHLMNAMLLLGVLVVAALRAADRRHGASRELEGLQEPPAPAGARPPMGLIHLTATLGFIVILFGALTANLNAGLLCLGFPLCEGVPGGGPPGSAAGQIHWLHRILAFSFLALAITLVGRLRAGASPALRRAAAATLIVALSQVTVAALMVLNVLPAGLRALHLLVGTLLWVCLLVMVYAGRAAADTGRFIPQASPFKGEASQPVSPPSLPRDLITLTKPRIISLLLLTTVAPMFITDRGVPPLGLVLWVILGGYLMAGGANTINMWFDRDIDCLVARTRLRPIPSGRIPPTAALLFGLAQGAAAFMIFWRQVNPLSAWLALGGLLFYVLIYTVWLKRTSPQNIVIGGAAGAFPPLVGWTAVTGSLDLAALYLFAIVFFWTPPHFWALALVKQQEYARAGVPMMPVVQGERWTKIQMLAYTLMLLPLTLMPSVFGALGLFYAAAALGLGGRLLWYNLRLLRDAGVTPVAWRMYKYSLLYLALLFLAMGVDRALPFGHRFERVPIYILSHPESDQGVGAGSVPGP